jgi:hypothetical protein
MIREHSHVRPRAPDDLRKRKSVDHPVRMVGDNEQRP